MSTQVIMVLASALLAAVLTLALGFLAFNRYYKHRLQRELDEKLEAYLQRLQETIDEEATKAGDLIEQKVRQGLIDGVSSLPSSQVLQKTTDSVVQTGVDLVGASLNTILRGRPPRKS